jgi:hypothetical protein
MPRVIDCPTEEVLDLETVVDMLETQPFDARDEEHFVSWGEVLKKLSNNRTFLADLMIAELKQRCEGQLRDNQYNSQVILLHMSRKGFMMRANMWPAMDDPMVRQSGTDPFFFYVPHDHNFSFLTVGHLGPGYWSDYYEYEFDDVVGHAGEKVDIQFVERARLHEGKVMLYRAHKDIHRQLPADSMSVSLNIVETSHCITFRDQYRFNAEESTLERIMTRSSLEPMLALAAHHGGGNGIDLLDNFAAAHPSDRVRWGALKARAGAAASIDERIALLEQGTRGDSNLVAQMARRQIDQLEATRHWIERAPVPETA